MSHDQVRTYLQMLSLGQLRPAPEPDVRFEVTEQSRWSPIVRDVTLDIGRAHQWPSQGWTDQQWHSYLARPYLRHWLAVVDGEPAGLLSVDALPTGDVEIDTFGLLPEQVGRGIGGHFLTIGVRLAWAAGRSVCRVWLHTSSRDHPAALPNYEQRGFQRYDVPVPH